MIGKLIHIILRLQIIIVGILLQILIAYHVTLDCIWCGKEISWLYSCRFIRLDGLEPIFSVCKQENTLQITWPLGVDQFVVQIGITLLHTVLNLLTELILFILVVEECVNTVLRIIDVIEADEY